MTEPTEPHLDAPSEALKLDLAELMRAHVPVGEEHAEFVHPDGRIFGLCPPEEEDDDLQLFVVDVQTPLVGEDGNPVVEVAQYIYDAIGGTVEREEYRSKELLLFMPEEHTPELVAEQKRLAQVRKDSITELEKRGYDEDEVMEASNEATKAEALSSDILLQAIFRAVKRGVHEQEEDRKLGINQLSGTDLQNLIDDIRAAVDNTPK